MGSAWTWFVAFAFFALILLGVFGVMFLVTSGLYWVIAWSFDLPFEWKYAVGVTLVWLLINQLFQSRKKANNDCL